MIDSNELRTVVSGSERSHRPDAEPEEVVNPAEQITVTVVLRRPAPPQAVSAGAETMSRVQFAAEHGADPDDVARVEAFARSCGIAVDQVHRAARTMTLTGTAEGLQRAFGVGLHRYDVPGGGYRGREGHVSIPAEVRDVIVAVRGLGNLPGVGPHLRIRPATRDDVDRIVEIMHGEPGAEAVAMAGTADRARQSGRGLCELEDIPNAERPTVVAESDGRVVGVLQYNLGAGDIDITLALVRLALRTFGPVGTLRLLPRQRARARVNMPIPKDSCYIAEINVAPECRGGGVGGALLDWADGEAVRLGATRMTLTTTTVNPARRLYERKGFVVTKTATDSRYQHYTGIPGRVLMEKRVEA